MSITQVYASQLDNAFKFWRRRKTFAFVFWSVVYFLLSIPVVVWIPEKMVQSVYHGDNANDYAKLIDDYRRTLVQMIGGSALIATLYFTYRRTRAAEHTLRLSQRTLDVTRETQITDRFTKAVGQLGAVGSDGKKQLEIRLGAIYALERIAKDSPHDHWTIMEILTAYVRAHSLPCESANQHQPLSVSYIAKSDVDFDVQTALTVIGRRNRANDKGVIDLRGAHLPNAVLVNAHFERAILQGVNLFSAKLAQVHLEQAILSFAHLERAWLSDAHLENATLHHIHLERAKLDGAHLGQADLLGAFLSETVLRGANLEEVNLSGALLDHADVGGANLSNARITQKQLDSAYGNEETIISPHFQRPGKWRTQDA